MIYRRIDQGWVVFTQATHAWLSGQLIRAWGNDEFTVVDPREALIIGTSMHDIGWLAWDENPRIKDNGEPVNFIETDLDETILLWQRAVRYVELINPYAALLVSCHASTVFNRRLERDIDTPKQQSLIRQVLESHQHLRDSLQTRLANHSLYGSLINEEQLTAAYRLLRVCDLLSLIICSDILPLAGKIEDVPAHNIHERITIRYHRPDPVTLHLEPFPFTQPELDIQISARHMPQHTFLDQASLIHLLNNTDWTEYHYRIGNAAVGDT